MLYAFIDYSSGRAVLSIRPTRLTRWSLGPTKTNRGPPRSIMLITRKSIKIYSYVLLFEARSLGFRHGFFVGQSEPSANDDNRWPVCTDVSRWRWIHLAMGSIGRPCRTIQGSVRHPSLITACSSAEEGIYMWWGQANNPGSSSFEGGICLWSRCSSIASLDQQSLSQAWIECIIKHYWPSFPPPL